jgi:hypothetical protein
MLLNDNIRHEVSTACVNGFRWGVGMFILLGGMLIRKVANFVRSALGGVAMICPAGLRMLGHVV